MRKARLVQLGIVAGLACTAMGVGSMAGCSSDDNGTTEDSGVPNNTPDATTDTNTNNNPDTGPTTDAGAPDTNPPAQDAKLILVNAAPALGAVRFCFSATTQGTTVVYPAPPQPDTAIGVPPGTGGVFPDFGIDLSGYDITAYAIPISKLASPDAGSEPSCSTIFGAGADAGTPGVDYFTVNVPSGTLQVNNTYLLSLVGCPANTDDAGYSPATCGSDYDGGTNVALAVAQLDTTTDAGGSIGVQFAQRSVAIQTENATADTTNLGVPGVNKVHGPASAGVIPGILYTDLDGGPDGSAIEGFLPLDSSETPVQYSPTGITLSTATVLPQLNQSDPGAGFGVLTLPGSDDGGAIKPTAWPGGDLFGLPLPTIQEFVTGTAPGANATMFAPGETYTFVLLGDPTQTLGAGFINDAGSPDFAPGNTPLLGLHFLAFPNHPTVTKLTP